MAVSPMNSDPHSETLINDLEDYKRWIQREHCRRKIANALLLIPQDEWEEAFRVASSLAARKIAGSR